MTLPNWLFRQCFDSLLNATALVVKARFLYLWIDRLFCFKVLFHSTENGFTSWESPFVKYILKMKFDLVDYICQFKNYRESGLWSWVDVHDKAPIVLYFNYWWLTLCGYERCHVTLKVEPATRLVLIVPAKIKQNSF